MPASKRESNTHKYYDRWHNTHDILRELRTRSKTAKFLRRTSTISDKKNLQIETIPSKDNPAYVMTKLTPMSSLMMWKGLWMSSVELDGWQV